MSLGVLSTLQICLVIATNLRCLVTRLAGHLALDRLAGDLFGYRRLVPGFGLGKAR